MVVVGYDFGLLLARSVSFEMFHRSSQNHPWIDSWNVCLDWLIDHAFCCS